MTAKILPLVHCGSPDSVRRWLAEVPLEQLEDVIVLAKIADSDEVWDVRSSMMPLASLADASRELDRCIDRMYDLRDEGALE